MEGSAEHFYLTYLSKMTDQPATTPPNQQAITINLSDMAQRYLGAMQRIYDIGAMVVQGTREVNERGYDEMGAATHFLPSQKEKKAFDAAKPIAERWLLKNLLTDAFGLFVPFIEDARTICALFAWKKAGSDQTTLAPIFQEQRTEFVKKTTAEKVALLKEKHNLTPQLGDHVASLDALTGCLVRAGGTVPKDGQPLLVTFVTLEVPASADPTKKVQPRMGEQKREFAPGTEVSFEKVDVLNILSTLALFMNSTLRALQDHIKE